MKEVNFTIFGNMTKTKRDMTLAIPNPVVLAQGQHFSFFEMEIMLRTLQNYMSVRNIVGKFF